MADKHNIPIGVKIISVLYYISAFALGLLGILAIALPQFVPLPIPGVTSQIVLGVFGLVIIGLGVLSFFIARGLWKGKQWAYVIVILFSVLGVINDIVSFFLDGYSNIVLAGLLFNGVIACYLIFDKDVKRAFVGKK